MLFRSESVWVCEYPAQFGLAYKVYGNNQSPKVNNGRFDFDDAVTITKSYEAVSHYLGFGFIEAGKTMGLAPYGQEDPDLPKFFIEGKGNKNLLKPLYPAGSQIDEDRFPLLKRYSDPKEWHNDFSLCRDIDKNLA